MKGSGDMKDWVREIADMAEAYARQGYDYNEAIRRAKLDFYLIKEMEKNEAKGTRA